MTIGRRRALFLALVLVHTSLLGAVAVARQAGADQAPLMSDTYFKNVQVLKGIPVDEFMDVMGMFSASLGYDCVSCHSEQLYNDRAAFAISTPAIQRARQMFVMMNAINKQYFGGQPRMSCFTCHRGQNRPGNIPSLAIQYGELLEDPNSITIFPDTRTTVEAQFAKYIQAVGGAQRLAALTSFVAKGSYEGFNTGGGPVPIEIYASAPDKRAQVVQAPEGESTKTFDGQRAWAAEPWRPSPLLPLVGGNLSGAKLEAMVQFPAGIQKAFSQWRISGTEIDGKRVQVLQGVNGTELPVNFYFDETGLLVRIVRWNSTISGVVPTQIDYSDYRDVAGVKLPYKILMTWTDGQNTFTLSEIQPNVTINPTRFARPAPFARR
ncbi:MAG: photosynthetic reaction center cytochrome c subunit [Acidobacteria bacterium]|nr:photosynthetic reaction center cytochrome c subunit [Acidobacteriota bacterium]